MTINKLSNKAHWLRREVLEKAVACGKGHLGGTFSCIELLITLYYSDLFKLSSQKNNNQKDIFILSKGHAGLALYIILSDLGFINKIELKRYGQNESKLGGHPDHFIPGIIVSSGSLGHGLGIGCGLALSNILNKKSAYTIVLLGDGECNEGSVWEAAAFACQRNLFRLIAIIDDNKISATDYTKNLVGKVALTEKWKSFGWQVFTVNGHKINDINRILKKIKNKKNNKPVALIAETIKGKGISFMENNPNWHHGIPKDAQLKQAREELGL